MSIKKIGIIGSGAWGTAMASVLAENGHEVCVYGIDENEINDISVKRKNAKYFGEYYRVHDNVKATLDFGEVVKYNDVFVLAVPSFAIKETIEKIKPHVKNDTVIVNLAKGFEAETKKTVGQFIRSLLPSGLRKNVVSLLGPTYATEVAEKQVTAITASADSFETSKKAKEIFQNDYLRVFPNNDPIGSEYCSGLKNVIALACGISDGLGYKVNTRSAIMTEGLKEIAEFVESLGGNVKTCFGLAGVGDLVLTCSSNTSRNYTAGYEIGKTSVEEFLYLNRKTVEGVFAAEIAYEIAKENNLKAPLIEFIYDVLIAKKDMLSEITILKDKIIGD